MRLIYRSSSEILGTPIKMMLICATMTCKCLKPFPNLKQQIQTIFSIKPDNTDCGKSMNKIIAILENEGVDESAKTKLADTLIRYYCQLKASDREEKRFTLGKLIEHCPSEIIDSNFDKWHSRLVTAFASILSFCPMKITDSLTSIRAWPKCFTFASFALNSRRRLLSQEYFNNLLINAYRVYFSSIKTEWCKVNTDFEQKVLFLKNSSGFLKDVLLPPNLTSTEINIFFIHCGLDNDFVLEIINELLRINHNEIAIDLANNFRLSLSLRSANLYDPLLNCKKLNSYSQNALINNASNPEKSSDEDARKIVSWYLGLKNVANCNYRTFFEGEGLTAMRQHRSNYILNEILEITCNSKTINLIPEFKTATLQSLFNTSFSDVINKTKLCEHVLRFISDENNLNGLNNAEYAILLTVVFENKKSLAVSKILAFLPTLNYNTEVDCNVATLLLTTIAPSGKRSVVRELFNPRYNIQVEEELNQSLEESKVRFENDSALPTHDFRQQINTKNTRDNTLRQQAKSKICNTTYAILFCIKKYPKRLQPLLSLLATLDLDTLNSVSIKLFEKAITENLLDPLVFIIYTSNYQLLNFSVILKKQLAGVENYLFYQVFTLRNTPSFDTVFQYLNNSLGREANIPESAKKYVKEFYYNLMAKLFSIVPGSSNIADTNIKMSLTAGLQLLHQDRLNLFSESAINTLQAKIFINSYDVQVLDESKINREFVKSLQTINENLVEVKFAVSEYVQQNKVHEDVKKLETVESNIAGYLNTLRRFIQDYNTCSSSKPKELIQQIQQIPPKTLFNLKKLLDDLPYFTQVELPDSLQDYEELQSDVSGLIYNLRACIENILESNTKIEHKTLEKPFVFYLSPLPVGVYYAALQSVNVCNASICNTIPNNKNYLQLGIFAEDRYGNSQFVGNVKLFVVEENDTENILTATSFNTIQSFDNSFRGLSAEIAKLIVQRLKELSPLIGCQKVALACDAIVISNRPGMRQVISSMNGNQNKRIFLTRPLEISNGRFDYEVIELGLV